MNYYIDYENTKHQGLKGLEYLDRNDTVYIFFSSHAPTVPRYYERIIKKNDINVQTRKLFQIGKNGLDFYIASQIGADIHMAPAAIISEDTGFQAVQDYWERIAPSPANIILGRDIEDVLMQCTGVLADYVKASKEMLPVEALRNTATVKLPELASETPIVISPAIKPSNSEELIDCLIQEGAKKCYAKCITKYGAGAPEIYQQIKISAMPRIISDQDYMEIQSLINGGYEEEALRLCKRKYGRSLYNAAFEYISDGSEVNDECSEHEELEEISDNIFMTENESIQYVDECRNFDMYGSVEAIGIAGCILEFKDNLPVSINKITECLSGSEQANSSNYYFKAFAGIKHADIKASIIRLSQTGCFSVKNDTIYEINEELMKSFENPVSYAFGTKNFQEYKDVDWIDLIHSGTLLKNNEWKEVIPMFNRVYLLSMFKEDICGFLRRAPKDIIKKINNLEKKANGARANLLHHLISQVGKAA